MVNRVYLDDIHEYSIEYVFNPARPDASSWVAIATVVQRPTGQQGPTVYRLPYEDAEARFQRDAEYLPELPEPGLEETIYVSRSDLLPHIDRVSGSVNERAMFKIAFYAEYESGEKIQGALLVTVRARKETPDIPVVKFKPSKSDKESEHYCILAEAEIEMDRLFEFAGPVLFELATDGEPPLLQFVDAALDTLKPKVEIAGADITAHDGKLNLHVGISWKDMERAYREQATEVTSRLSTRVAVPLPAEPVDLPEVPVRLALTTRKRPERLIFELGKARQVCALDGPTTSCRFEEAVLRHGDNITLDGASHIALTLEGSRTLSKRSKCDITLVSSDNEVRTFETRISPDGLIVFPSIPKLSKPAHDRLEVTAMVLTGAISLQGDDGSKSRFKWTVEIPVTVDTPLPRYLYSVDFGTSATSIGIATLNDRSEVEFVTLPLGKWLEEVDNLHDESKAFDDEANGDLIPSHIGLSSRLNQRVRFDPLSLGKLSRVGSDQAATIERLDALDMSYDVSIPASSFAATSLFRFDSGSTQSQPRTSDSVESAVWNLKTTLLRPGRETEASGDIYYRHPNGNLDTSRFAEADVLLRDYMRELGRYVTLRSALLAKKAGVRIAQYALEAPADEIGVVLAHPSGLSPDRVEAYRRAGMAFLASVTGLPVTDGLRCRVYLAPEAVAAAATRPISHGADEKLVVGLDIGAGTYDVAVISAPGGARKDWTIVTDFAVHVAGRILDRLLTRLVATILQSAGQSLDIARHLDIQSALPESIVDIKQYGSDLERARGAEFVRAIRRAKTAITVKAQRQSGHYRWPSGEPFEVLLGNSAAGIRSPVRRRISDEIGVYPIANVAAKLVVRAEEIVLQIDKSLLTERIEGLPVDIAKAAAEYMDVLTLLGTAIPDLVMDIVSDISKGNAASAMEWRVTGRTSLWPPLFERIDERISANGIATDSHRPASPSVMKRSVVQGAAILVCQGRHRTIRQSPSYAAVLAGCVASNGSEQIQYIRGDDFREPKELPFSRSGARLVETLPYLDRNNQVLQLIERIVHSMPPSEAAIQPFDWLATIKPTDDAKLQFKDGPTTTHYEIKSNGQFERGVFRGLCK